MVCSTSAAYAAGTLATAASAVTNPRYALYFDQYAKQHLHYPTPDGFT